ncbi:MAG: hypothetical protein ABL970_06620 [Nitrospira sp.]
MVKSWPDGPLPGSMVPRRSIDVQVGLAAKADALALMVWIAAGGSVNRSLVRCYHVDEQGQAHHTILASDGAQNGSPVEASTDACERGGFGWTGGQFYKTGEGL